MVIFLCKCMSVRSDNLSSPIVDRRTVTVRRSAEKDLSASQFVTGTVHASISNVFIHGKMSLSHAARDFIILY